jgi:hypothetical protein
MIIEQWKVADGGGGGNKTRDSTGTETFIENNKRSKKEGQHEVVFIKSMTGV